MRVTRCLAPALAGAVLFSFSTGCKPTQPTAGTPDRTAVASGSSTAAAQPDDPAAVAELEAAGAKLQKDAGGAVIVVDLRDAGGGNRELFAAAAKLPSLKTLVCTGAEVNNAAVAELRGHGALERFDATSRSGIGDEGAEALGTVATLVDLNLEKSAISDAAYPHFAQLKNLRRLRAPFTNTSDAGLKALADATQLELLDFRDCTGVSDEGILALEKLTKLRSFKVWGPRITDRCLPAVGGWTNLVSLGFQDTHVGGTEALSALTKLQDLDVFRSHFNDTGLQAIAGASGIKTLKLRDCRVTPAGLKTLGGFANLERLDLSESKADDSTLAAISALPKLVDLDLWASRVSDDGLQNLVKLPLKNLVLDDIYDVTDFGMVHVGQIKSLETLSLVKTGVTDEGLRDLEGLENLRVLQLDNTTVSKKAVEALRQKLPKLERVTL
jgi:internalin A